MEAFAHRSETNGGAKTGGRIRRDRSPVTLYTPDMVRDRWNFSGPPFASSLEPAAFYLGAPQEESLARLEWLLEERQRCALVVGGEGMGKSHLAAVSVRRLAGLGAEVAMLSLRGLAAGDWLDLLLGRLPLDPASRAEALRPWQKLENRLRENTLMERPTALIVDDIDHAPQDALEGIARIVGAGEPLFARTFVVVTATPAGVPRIPDAIRSRSVVRIELAPWDEQDVAGFVTRSLARVGAETDLFSPDAIGTIGRFSGGVPRMACHLAQLAIAAAAGDDLERVDAAVIERVWRELTPMTAPRAAAETVEDGDDDPSDEPRPQVRVVRRLWG
jgi:type II secretory pathway predicted ATPase ExeA